MLYSILLQTCKWLEYASCYCFISAEMRGPSDPDRHDYEKLANELNETVTPLFEQVLFNNDPHRPLGTNYQCFI